MFQVDHQPLNLHQLLQILDSAMLKISEVSKSIYWSFENSFSHTLLTFREVTPQYKAGRRSVGEHRRP